MLKDVFGFSQCQEKGTFRLCYRLTSRGYTDSAVLNKDNAINTAKNKFIAIEWYVPHYKSSISNQAIFSKQFSSKTPTKLQYVERYIFMKEVKTQNFWTFELGRQEGINIHIWIKVGFQQRDRQDSQNLNNDTSHTAPVTSAQCIIGTEKYPGSTILNYDDDHYSQGYGQINETFRALTKDDILQPYISAHDFRSTKNGDDIGYNLYVFDIRYQKDLEKAQPKKVEFKFSANILAGIYGYALVITKELVGISSDGQRHFDLFQD